jgi:hypothetical protein
MITARDWLSQNGYEDVATLIDEVLAELKAKGSKERRNWWDILSGNCHGNSRIVVGRKFPVLAVAQKRQGKPITPNAIRSRKRTAPPEIRKTGRWPITIEDTN